MRADIIIDNPLTFIGGFHERYPLAALLIGSIALLPGLLQAQDNKPVFPKVTLDELKKDPEKYQGQVVQIEGSLAADPVSSERTQVQRFYLRIARPMASALSYTPTTGLSKGDRVRITATFVTARTALIQ